MDLDHYFRRNEDEDFDLDFEFFMSKQDRKEDGMTESEGEAILAAHERHAKGSYSDNIPLVYSYLCGSCDVIWDGRNPSGCPKCSSAAASESLSKLWRKNESS